MEEVARWWAMGRRFEALIPTVGDNDHASGEEEFRKSFEFKK